MKKVVVIPAFNEEKMIKKVISEVAKYVDLIIVVDDGSEDKTYEKALETKKAIVLKHIINRGQGAALMTGIEKAKELGAQIVITFDADFQHNPKDIPKFVSKIKQGYDVVLGSRFLKKNKIPFLKKIVLKLAIAFTNFIYDINLTDTHNGFRAFSKKALQLIRIKSDRMAHASEIIEQIKKYNLKFIEIPVEVYYTEYSKSKGQKITNAFRILYELIINKRV